MPHPQPNFNRMLQLIDDVFATRSDPGQLQVTKKQAEKLQAIHPATLSEIADANGPVTWALLIPTTQAVMQEFVNGKMTEKQLLDHTQPGQVYTCIYLCSVTTLPEYRHKGSTKALCLQAIRSICSDHAIKTLFVWPFTKEGNQLAETLAKECGLELIKKPDLHSPA